MKFSPSTLGFYGDGFPPDKVPADAIDISDSVYEACQPRPGDPPQELHVGADGLPALKNIEALAPTPGEAIAAARAARAAAYREESDPLFFQVQRGEALHADWLAKVAEIKLRLPDPTA